MLSNLMECNRYCKPMFHEKCYCTQEYFGDWRPISVSDLKVAANSVRNSDLHIFNCRIIRSKL